MKALLTKKVKVLKWFIPLWVILVPTLIVAAWGIYSTLMAYSVGTVDVADAPIPPSVSYPVGSRYCVVNSGSGSANGTWNAAARTYTCAISGFDDTTRAEFGLGVTNDLPSNSISISAALPASDPCAAFSEDQSFAASLSPGGSSAGVWQIDGVAGPTGTITCSGTSLGDFSVDLTIDVIP